MASITLNFKVAGQDLPVVLDEKEQQAYARRSFRNFLKRAPLDSLKEKIEKAKTIRELEDLTRAYDLASLVDYEDFSLPAAKALSSSIATVLYDFPFVRGVMDFVGSFKSYKFLALDFADGKDERKIGLSEFMDKNELSKFGKYILKDVLDLIGGDSRGITWAYFINLYGIFQGVLIDEEDIAEGHIYFLKKNIASCEATGFHPKGCLGLESVYFHELGHAIDCFCGLSNGMALNNLFKSLSKEEIKAQLSEYASTEPQEFVAEAISEHYSSPSPRPLCKKVHALMKERYEFAVKKGPKI